MPHPSDHLTSAPPPSQFATLKGLSELALDPKTKLIAALFVKLIFANNPGCFPTLSKPRPLRTLAICFCVCAPDHGLGALTRFALRAAESRSSIDGIIHLHLDISVDDYRRWMKEWFPTAPDEVSLSLTEPAVWSTPAAKVAIEKLAAQVAHITGQANPVIFLELDPSMFDEVQNAWKPLVAQDKHTLLTSGVGIRKAISSPSKENENENGNTRESESYSSLPCAATQELDSGDRRLRRVPASLRAGDTVMELELMPYQAPPVHLLLHRPRAPS